MQSLMKFTLTFYAFIINSTSHHLYVWNVSVKYTHHSTHRLFKSTLDIISCSFIRPSNISIEFRIEMARSTMYTGYHLDLCLFTFISRAPYIDPETHFNTVIKLNIHMSVCVGKLKSWRVLYVL